MRAQEMGTGSIRNRKWLPGYTECIILICFYFTGCLDHPGKGNETVGAPIGAEINSANTEAQAGYLLPVIEQATTEKKNILLIFGSPSCAPCRRFEHYLGDSSVHRIISKYFIVRTFDVIKSAEGKQIYSLYWKMGMPSWTILDTERNILADSSNPSTGSGNIGYPGNSKDLAHYELAIKKGAPGISKAELKILTGKIIDYSARRDQY